MCRHSCQQGLACTSEIFGETGQKQTLFAQFTFIFAGPLLFSWSIKREETETDCTHTFNPCSKYLPASVDSAGSYPVPHEGHPFIHSQEQGTEKANAWLLSEPQTFFLNIQTFLLSLVLVHNQIKQIYQEGLQNTMPQMINEGHLGKSPNQRHPSQTKKNGSNTRKKGAKFPPTSVWSSVQLSRHILHQTQTPMKIKIKLQPSSNTPKIHLKLMGSMNILEKPKIASAPFLE